MTPLRLLAATAVLGASLLAPSFAEDNTDNQEHGFSVRRLARIDAAVQESIDQGRLAGALVYIAREGETVRLQPYGLSDREKNKPMRADALFRIASMSKAVTTVAVLQLYEQGKFLLTDPISRHIPAFRGQQVAVPAPAGSPEGVKFVLEKAKREVTIRDLLTHTAGLTYGDGPAVDLYDAAKLHGWYLAGHNETIGEVVDRLAKLPLQGQPGESYQYGYATDVLGRLVEVVSGQPLDVYVRENICKPLKMVDTDFYPPLEKADRLMPVYGYADGKLTLRESSDTSDYFHGPRKCFGGGAGLISTASDYGRFLQMLANGGELDGVRLLSPELVRMATVNQLGSVRSWFTGHFGFGFWVNDNDAYELAPHGSYGWGSAYYPQYLVDPERKIVAIFFTQLMPAGDLNLNERFKVLVTQAIVK
ncbi:serine hydrolase domain-containing protein [Nibricoccus sp. IMCC34717]|uniref:serine hydrolase domain-containing protein n=1 Tax=Nibricoccus sp. IMCC34717 TaxID=3034021 RepID=UPI00384E9D90